MVRITDELQEIVSEIPSEISEKKGVYSFEVLLAERKVFLSRKRLVYAARFHVDEDRKEVVFSEMLKESGSGLSSGSLDNEISTGFGFKKESYNTFSRSREGTLKEQSELFRKKYDYTFDFGEIRRKFEERSTQNGYRFISRLALNR